MCKVVNQRLNLLCWWRECIWGRGQRAGWMATAWRLAGWLAGRRDSNLVWRCGAAAASSVRLLVAGELRHWKLPSSGPATILITFITINVHGHCFFHHLEIPCTCFSRITKLMFARGLTLVPSLVVHAEVKIAEQGEEDRIR